MAFRKPDDQISDKIQYIDDNVLLLCGDHRDVFPQLHMCVDTRQFEPTLIVSDPPYEFESRGGGLYKDSESMEKVREIGTDSFAIDDHIPTLIQRQAEYTGFINAYFFCNIKLVYKYLHIAYLRGMIEDILLLNRKVAPPAHNNHYVSHVEYCMFLRKKITKKPTFNGSLDMWDGMYRKIFDWSGKKISEHANEKPVALMKQYIEISSMPGDIVIDPFMGSGTTGVAAKECGRMFIGIDIDPASVQTAITRLSQYSLF
jgi:site-specific DNA-methyltransferase (adenine-specific)